MPPNKRWGGMAMAVDGSVDLRAMVREVLRETLAARGAPVTGVQRITITSDADLQAFVARLTAPGAIEALRAGSLKFAWSAAVQGGAAVQAGVPHPGGLPVMEGVISERKLQGFVAGATVHLAAGAVVTPMGKDVARRLGLKFERIG